MRKLRHREVLFLQELAKQTKEKDIPGREHSGDQTAWEG
jgi:hypothetical protein